MSNTNYDLTATELLTRLAEGDTLEDIWYEWAAAAGVTDETQLQRWLSDGADCGPELPLSEVEGLGVSAAGLLAQEQAQAALARLTA